MIVVPAGIRYIGQWKEFKLSSFPAKCILNKVLPGCGFTRYCLESPWENVILCSPRKILLQNKYEQHSRDVFLVKNKYDMDPEVDKDLDKDPKKLRERSSDELTKEQEKILDEYEDPMKNHLTEIKSSLHTDLREYLSSHVQHKILVTYDSFRVLKEVLQEMGIFQNFFDVIDEMQAIMGDARFKSSTEINFLYHLQDSHSALFVSATPMLEEYLDELPEFRDLPYYELDWKTEDFSRITRPDLEIKSMMASPRLLIERIIEEYNSKGGYVDVVSVLRNNQKVDVYATELVFYLNSVSSIISAIKSCDLKDEEVNILCSNTPENQRRIWARLGGKKDGLYKIGRVPLEGEPRKKFTFCTRTVYLGADFYSNCAKSYIFSDANSKYLSVDISQDLPQILGRQRCDDNPWKNSAVLYYKLTVSKNKKSDYDKIIKDKLDATESLLRIWSSTLDNDKEHLSENYLQNIRAYHYSTNYVAINKAEFIDPATGKKIYKMVPVENILVRVAEKRAFDIQQIDYADRFSVFTALSGEFQGGFSKDSSDQNPIEFQVTKFFEVYDSLTHTSDRLKLLCEIPATSDAIKVILAQLPNTNRVKSLYLIAGPDRCKAVGYRLCDIEKEIGVKFFSKGNLQDEIYQEFSEGEKVLKSAAKDRLKEVYQRLNYQKTPKATDLKNFFEIKDYMITDPVSKKRVAGYELLRRLNP